MLRDFKLSLGGSLAEGYVIIPNILFGSIIFNHYGEYKYILPFVLLYSFEKAGIFAINGFGKINNPFKIVIFGLLLSIIGSFVSLLGSLNYVFWLIGAILIGAGLSCYSALYKTIRDVFESTHLWNKNVILYVGYIYFVIITSITAIYSMIFHYNVMYAFLFFGIWQILVLSGLINLYLCTDFVTRDAFLNKGFSIRDFVPSICILVLTLFIRLVKQTSNIYYLMGAAAGFCVFIITGFKNRNIFRKNHGIKTFWFGFVRNFIVIFSLIYFIVLNNNYMVAISYVMIASGILMSILIRSKIRRYLKSYSYTLLTICGSVVSLFLLFSDSLYIVGIFLCALFISMGNNVELKVFKNDGDIDLLERRTARLQIYSLGALVQQIILISVIALSSYFYFNKANTILEAYVFNNDFSQWNKVFFMVKFICVFIIAIFGMYILINEYKLKSPEVS